MADSINKMRLRSSRGLLENDIILERFFKVNPNYLSKCDEHALSLLLELGDNELLDLLLKRTEPTGNLDIPEIRSLLKILRSL